MNLILDTHVILWWLNDDDKLTNKHRKVICDPENICYISSVSIWEIAIKTKLGKLEITANYTSELKKEGFIELAFNWEHADKVKKLPLHHKDPFDRALIAQAQIEKLTLLTVDELIINYDVDTI